MPTRKINFKKVILRQQVSNYLTFHCVVRYSLALRKMLTRVTIMLFSIQILCSLAINQLYKHVYSLMRESEEIT